jgi:hypothetical protein
VWQASDLPFFGGRPLFNPETMLLPHGNGVAPSKGEKRRINIADFPTEAMAFAVNESKQTAAAASLQGR